MKLFRELVAEAKKIAFNGIEEMPDEMYEYFFRHYSSTGEMPIGVVRSITGDPYLWIENKIQKEEV